MSKSMIIGALSAGVVLAAASCMQPEAGKTEQDTGHWVHSAHLQQIMMDLQTATEQDWPATSGDASASEQVRREMLDDACVLAAELGKSAERIPLFARHAGVPEEDMNRFVAEAHALQIHAMELEKAGHRGDVQGMHDILNNISASCDACHVQFRDLAGPLN